MSEAFVKLEQVTKVYRMGEVEIRAVDGIDFEINQGEFISIIGPNGSGKSTLAKHLNAFDKKRKDKNQNK